MKDLSACDCPSCRRPTWRKWLEGDPGPWATAFFLGLVTFIIFLAAMYGCGGFNPGVD